MHHDTPLAGKQRMFTHTLAIFVVKPREYKLRLSLKILTNHRLSRT